MRGIDLTGKRFGRLTVLKIAKSKKGKRFWLCECDCGNETSVTTTHLNRGAIKSCGCLKSEITRDRTFIDLTGKRFGRWYVIKENGVDKYKQIVWLCKCDCGTEKDVSGNSLRKGTSKSCGCYNAELVSKRIGKLSLNWKGGVNKLNIPLYDTYAHQIDWCEKVRRDPDNYTYLQVKCAYCGKWYVPISYNVGARIASLNGTGSGEGRFYCSKECKKLCPIFWKQTKSAEETNTKQLSREVQPELRQMVFERDNWKCVKCGSIKSLTCHHKEGIRWNPIESADIDMCVTLCKSCHKKVHKKEGCSYHDMMCNN